MVDWEFNWLKSDSMALRAVSFNTRVKIITFPSFSLSCTRRASNHIFFPWHLRSGMRCLRSRSMRLRCSNRRSWRWGEHCPVVECPRSSRIWIHIWSAVLVHELLWVYVFRLLLWCALFNISIFRGYLHAAIGISSCLWPPGVLIDHDGSFGVLCPTPYYQLCTLEPTSISTHLVRYSAVCTSTCPAHSSGSHLVFQLYKRGISFILSPYAESSAIIDLIGQVGISWCYVVAWPDLPQSALTIRMVLSLAQHTVPDLPRLLYQVIRNMWISRMSALLRAIRHEDYLLLPSHTCRTSSLFWQLTSFVPYILLNMCCPQLDCLSLRFEEDFLLSHLVISKCVMCAPAMWLLYDLK